MLSAVRFEETKHNVQYLKRRTLFVSNNIYNYINTNGKQIYTVTIHKKTFIFRQHIRTLITPAPVYANMIQTLVHTCRGLGWSIFIEINVKRQSNPSPLKVFNIQHCSAHIQPSTFISKYHFKKCVPFRHNSRVI